MMKISLLILTALMTGTAGVTVAFAQKSQPGDLLYSIRTWNQEMVHERVDVQLRDQNQIQVQKDLLGIGATVQEMNQLQLQIQNWASSGQQAGQTGIGARDQDRMRLQLKVEDGVQDQSRLQDRDRVHQSQP
jgi:hypothetical protein